MNRILAAASLALLVGTSSLVSAQAATAELKSYTMDAESDMRASELIGQRIYATASDVEGRTLTQAELAEFDDVGEINDIIMTSDGSVKAVVLGVGGFIGLGEQDVTVDMSSLRFVPETEGQGSFLVINANKDQLTALADQQQAEMAAATEAAAPAATDEVAATAESGTETVAEAGATAVEQTADAGATAVEQTGEAVVDTGEAVADTAENMTETAEAATIEGATTEGATSEAATTETATTETTETAEGTVTTTTVPMTEAPADTAATTDATAVETAEATPAVERETFVKPQVVTEGYTDVATNELTSDELSGKRIFDAQGQDIGEISEFVMAADGTTIDRIVLDVGGFLGLGERKIAVPADELQFTRNADGDFRTYIQATQQQLEAQPEYVAQ